MCQVTEPERIAKRESSTSGRSVWCIAMTSYAKEDQYKLVLVLFLVLVCLFALARESFFGLLLIEATKLSALYVEGGILLYAALYAYFARLQGVQLSLRALISKLLWWLVAGVPVSVAVGYLIVANARFG